MHSDLSYLLQFASGPAVTMSDGTVPSMHG
jgi:hypothetical protein